VPFIPTAVGQPPVSPPTVSPKCVTLTRCLSLEAKQSSLLAPCSQCRFAPTAAPSRHLLALMRTAASSSRPLPHVPQVSVDLSQRLPSTAVEPLRRVSLSPAASHHIPALRPARQALHVFTGPLRAPRQRRRPSIHVVASSPLPPETAAINRQAR
jgi:hypothetical protein